MTLYKNKNRIESSRLPGWDYSSPGYYFVTICTHNREHVFGEIVNREMILNRYGSIVYDEWQQTFKIRPSLKPDVFVVMPNHFHCIVHIANCGTTDPVVADDPVGTPWHGVPTGITGTGMGSAPELPQTTKQPGKTGSHPINWKSGVLGAIIGQFKIMVTKRIRKNGYPGFNWQFRFHDHIIRNDQELQRIREYIRNNPSNWAP